MQKKATRQYLCSSHMLHLENILRQIVLCVISSTFSGDLDFNRISIDASPVYKLNLRRFIPPDLLLTTDLIQGERHQMDKYKSINFGIGITIYLVTVIATVQIQFRKLHFVMTDVRKMRSCNNMKCRFIRRERKFVFLIQINIL